MTPFRTKSAFFDPQNQAHLDYFAVSYEGYTLSLEYVGGVMNSLRVVTTLPDGTELTRPRFWNRHCPSHAIDDTFQHELLPLIEYRIAHGLDDDDFCPNCHATRRADHMSDCPHFEEQPLPF